MNYKIQITPKWYTFKTSNLHQRALQVILYPYSLSNKVYLHLVNVQNRWRQKNALSPSFFLFFQGYFNTTPTLCTTFDINLFHLVRPSAVAPQTYPSCMHFPVQLKNLYRHTQLLRTALLLIALASITIIHVATSVVTL